MHEPEFRNNGALIFRRPDNDQLGYGSAFLISPNLVLTVAHNIFSLELNKNYKNWKFYFRPCGV